MKVHTEICTKCREEKPIETFKKDSRTSSGYASTCKSCASSYTKKYSVENKENIKTYRKEYYLENKEEVISKVKDWYSKNTDKKKEYDRIRVKENKVEIYAKNKKYRELNKEKERARQIKYYEENKVDFFVRAAKRRATKNRATPSWANIEKIKQIYVDCQLISEMTGVKHHVDHVVPLKGKMVSGLHVEYNLEILPANLNMAKHNKFLEDSL